MLDRLNELHQLMKSGVISKDEFDALKSEIINDDSVSSDNSIQAEIKNKQKVANGEKVDLRSFEDSDGMLIKAPSIQYLNLKDLSDDELEVLRPFIRQKQIHAPGEMTNDEIRIANKIFSALEIAEMDSERQGFNYAFQTIISVLAAAAAIYFMTISPCFVFLGAGTGLLASFFIAITVLNKADATKLDRVFSYVAIGLGIVAIIIYSNGWK